MSMMQRRKGKTWEREVARLLRPLFGDSVKRGWQSRCGREAPDVDGTPYWIECKHGRLVNLRAAVRQALDATDGRPVLVVAKDDRSDPLVVMRLSDWLQREQESLPRAIVQGLRGEADGEGGSDG